MKISNAIYVMLSIVLTLASCKSTKPVVSAEIETYTRDSIVIRDTLYVVSPDSSYYEAYLECANSKPIIREVLKEVPGSYLKAPSVSLKNGVLSVDCYKEAQKLMAQWKEQHRKKIITKTVTITKEVNRLTAWQRLRIDLGSLMGVGLLLFFIYKIIKYKFI